MTFRIFNNRKSALEPDFVGGLRVNERREPLELIPNTQYILLKQMAALWCLLVRLFNTFKREQRLLLCLCWGVLLFWDCSDRRTWSRFHFIHSIGR